MAEIRWTWWGHGGFRSPGLWQRLMAAVPLQRLQAALPGRFTRPEIQTDEIGGFRYVQIGYGLDMAGNAAIESK